MAIHKIVYLPDPVLRKVGAKVTTFDDNLRQLIADMFETMYDANGVGLAAPQIGISKQIAVIDVNHDQKEQYVLINPEIIEQGPLAPMQEGCLSVPGAYDTVKRAETVTYKAFDEHGKAYELSATGLLAEAVQHEIDHLNGKLFVDLLSPLKRSIAKRKLEKFKKQEKKKHA